ncbi:MAG TPA: acyl-CoA dehydrogenase family protein [Nocardioides sp.]|nr:acyl-CoA dehydrogenase family protein [Nocardioides sp.]
MKRSVYDEDHESYRQLLRRFIENEVVPFHADWEKAGHVPRDFYRRLGEIGVLGTTLPEEYGGGGASSYKYSAIAMEETARAGVTFGAYNVHTDLVTPYLLSYGTDAQRKRWLPEFATGETMSAIAMTEPGTGSDLANIQTRAVLSEDGTHYVLNGAKTFITGGAQADLVLVVARTAAPAADDRRGGLSLLLVESASEGFSIGRTLEKIGLKASDTAELFFEDVRVPAENLLGEPGRAFTYLSHNLPQERLGLAIAGVATAAAAVRFALQYVQERTVFGRPVAAFQNTKFVLAECATEVEAAQAMADRALELHDADELSAADAAKVKQFCTEVAGRVIDRCLQLYGGYGYMTEMPIARLYADTRVSRIYGGTSEVMKSIVAKSLDL